MPGRCRDRFIEDFITVQKKRPEPDFLPPDDFVDEDHPEEKDYPLWKRKRNVFNRLKKKNVNKVVLTGGDVSSDDRARPLGQSHQYQSRSLLAPDTHGASPDPRQSSRLLPPKFSYGEDEDEENEDHDDQLLTPGIGDDVHGAEELRQRGGDKMKNSLRLPPNSTVTTSWDSLLGEQQETTKGRTKNVTTTISGHSSLSPPRCLSSSAP